MPQQQQGRNGYARAIMCLLRCCWNGLYLWMQMHAASIVPVVYKRWQQGMLWNTRLPDKLRYQDALVMVRYGELWIVLMVVVVLRSMYICCGCQLVGVQNRVQFAYKPRVDFVYFCVPYLGSFLMFWGVTTLTTAYQMVKSSDATFDIYGQLGLALLFKLLIMANFIAVALRVHMSLVILEWGWEQGHISTLNFGERLNMLFRN